MQILNHNMYILTLVNQTGNSTRTYIQLRDEHMRLIAFFHPAKIEHVLKSEGISHLHDNILETLQKAQTGKLYHINSDK
jgi:hypothetical protein